MKLAEQPEIRMFFDADEAKELLPSHPVQQLSQHMQELYDDFARRIDRNEWQALMTEDFMWKVEYQKGRLNALIVFWSNIISCQPLYGRCWT